MGFFIYLSFLNISKTRSHLLSHSYFLYSKYIQRSSTRFTMMQALIILKSRIRLGNAKLRIGFISSASSISSKYYEACCLAVLES